MDTNFSFEELLALRVVLQDEYENESDIIKELRYELLQKGMHENDIPEYLKTFYDLYGINISLNTINETINNIRNRQNPRNLLSMFSEFFIRTPIISNLSRQPHYIFQENNDNLEDNNDEDLLEDNDEDLLEDNDNEIMEQANNPNLIEDIDNNLPALENNNSLPLENNNSSHENNNSSHENNNSPPENNNSSHVNNELPPLENPRDLTSSLLFTLNLNENDLNSSLFPIIPEQEAEELQNLLNNFINQQGGFHPLTSLFGHQLPFINNTPNIIQQRIPLNIHHQMYIPWTENSLMQDVKATLNEEELNNLKKYKIEKNLEEKCSVCMSDMEIEQEVCELLCQHIFHSECIEPYLKNYNYKCPVCRKEVGKPQFDI